MSSLKRLVIVSALSLSLVALGAGETTFAQATPTLAGTATVAGSCDVPNRDSRAMANLLASPVAQEAPRVSTISSESDLPSGEPLDDATLAAIEVTMSQFVDCTNAGSVFRSLNLVTDGFLRAQFGAETASLEEIDQLSDVLRDAIEASPIPLASGVASILVDLRDGRLLDDGRAGAVVQIRTGTETAPVESGFYIFQQMGDRWLIDAVIAIDSGGGATPIS